MLRQIVITGPEGSYECSEAGNIYAEVARKEPLMKQRRIDATLTIAALVLTTLLILTALLLASAVAFCLAADGGRAASLYPAGAYDWLGGGMVGGLLDHNFFNLDFPHSVTLFWLYVALAMAAARLGDTAN